MKGPKIMVFHIRQLLKTAAFVAAGIIVILLLIWVLTPGGRAGEPHAGAGAFLGSRGADAGFTLTPDLAFSDVLFVPGAYTALIQLDDSFVYVTVTVDAWNITDVRLSEMPYAQRTLFPLFVPVMEQLRTEILSAQSTNVSVPQTGPVTAGILLEAINLALLDAYVHVVTTMGL